MAFNRRSLGLPQPEVVSISEMHDLRNKVVHRDVFVSEMDALGYADLARKLEQKIHTRRIKRHLDPAPEKS